MISENDMAVQGNTEAKRPAEEKSTSCVPINDDQWVKRFLTQ